MSILDTAFGPGPGIFSLHHYHHHHHTTFTDPPEPSSLPSILRFYSDWSRCKYTGHEAVVGTMPRVTTTTSKSALGIEREEEIVPNRKVSFWIHVL